MTDVQLKALLNRGGIGETLYEGEIGETNMIIWHKLAEVFKNYYLSEKCPSHEINE